MLARAAFPAFFFTLGGFVLFLLVTLSVPIIKTIFLLKIKYPGGETAANVGVLGVCDRGGQASFAGIDYSGVSDCTHPKVGYELDTRLFGTVWGMNTSTVVIRALSGSLIVNAIAAGTAGASLFFAFFAWFYASRFMEISTFITLFLSSLVGWVAFWLNLALILVARNRINDYSDDVFSGHVGNGLWISLAGAVALTASICFAGCGIFGRYSNRGTRAAPIRAEKGYPRRFLGYAGTY